MEALNDDVGEAAGAVVELVMHDSWINASQVSSAKGMLAFYLISGRTINTPQVTVKKKNGLMTAEQSAFHTPTTQMSPRQAS